MADGLTSTTDCAVDILDSGGRQNYDETQQGTCFAKHWIRRHLAPHSKILQAWQIFVVLTIMVTVFLDTLMWSFDSRIRELWFIVYAMDAIYITNMVLKFFSAYYEKGIIITDLTRIRRHYMKTTFLIDLLTVIPLELIDLSPSLKSMKYLAVLRCNRLIRLYGVSVYFDTLESHLGTNVRRLLICKYLTIASLVVHLVACVWYALGCPGKHYGMDLTCRPESWAVTFTFGRDTEIDKASTLRSYVLSLYWAVTTATSTGYGELLPVTNGEKWFSICSMLMGIVIFFGIILGGMASQLTNLDTERAQYTHRLNVIKNHLRKSKISPEMGGKVIKYYKYLWYRNKGVSDQGLLNKLPITFHAEVSHSANQFVLDNAKVFKDLNPGFLRMLSLIIKPTLYLPGQLIVDHNDIMTTMYFIQRGELQVMDSKHQETPVGTLRCGQLFGEVNVVKTLARYNDIRASAHCDLLQLDRADLNSVLAHYPGIHQCLQKRVDTRLSRARQLEELLKAETKASCTVIEIDKGNQATHAEATVSDMESVNLATSSQVKEDEESEWGDRVRKWFVNSLADLKQFDWYFMPDSKPMIFWHYLVLFVAMAIGLLYPYLTSFTANRQEEDPDSKVKLFAIMFTMDAVLFLDIIVHLRTAHVTPNGTHRNFKSVRENYIQSFDFLLDVFAALPLDLISLIHPSGPVRTSFVYLLSLNRLIKVWRVSNYFAKKEENLENSIGLVRFGRFVLFIILFLHWNACGWYYGLYAQGREGFDETAQDGHMDPAIMTTPTVEASSPTEYLLAGQQNETSTLMEYLMAVYWTATTMTSTGYGDVTPHSIQTYIYAIWVEIGGLLLFGYILSSIAAILTNADMHRVRFLEALQATTTFMTDHKLSFSIKKRVVTNKHTNFKCHEGVHTPGGTRLMHDMPVNLQEDVADYETKDLFHQVPLFKDCDEAFLRRLALKTHRYVYAPGEIIITRGDKGRELYLVVNGFCEILSQGDVKKVITRVGPGGFFGEIAFMFGGERSSTVQAISSVDALVLHRKDLDNVLMEFPLIQQQIKEMEEDENFQREIHSAITEDELAVPNEPSTVKDLLSDDNVESHDTTYHPTNGIKKKTLERFDELTDKEKEIFFEPYRELGLFARIMSKCLLRTTINPEGLVTQVWETCRILISLAMVIIYMFQAAFLHMNVALWIVGYILDAICILEIYMRFHWAYYNEVGLLITHPLATCKKYLKNTFVLDLIACFPFEVLVYGAMKIWSPEALHIYAIIRFNRLLQLYRLPLAFNFLEGNMQINTGTVKEVKFFFYLMVFFHFLACIWFIQACPPVGFAGVDTTSHVQQGLMKAGDHFCSNNTWTMKFDNFVNLTPIQMYVVSLYWASATGASVGYGDITPSFDKAVEIIIAVIAMTSGILYFGYIIASVAASMANADSQRASYQELLLSASGYMKEKNVNSTLKDRIEKYYRYMWHRTKGIDPESLFDGLTLSLQADVSMALYKDIIEKVPLFSGTGESFIKTLASRIKPVYYMANEYVVKKFDHGENMFFIHRGAVDVVSEDGNIVFDTMKPGRFFGEISLIMSCPRTASIRAQTNCDMFILQKNDLDEVLLGYPSIKKQILEVAEERIAAVRKRSAAKVEVKKSEASATVAPSKSVTSKSSTQPASVVQASSPEQVSSKATVGTTPVQTPTQSKDEVVCERHDESSSRKGSVKEMSTVFEPKNLEEDSSDGKKIMVEPAASTSSASVKEDQTSAEVPDTDETNVNNNKPRDGDDAKIEEMEIEDGSDTPVGRFSWVTSFLQRLQAANRVVIDPTSKRLNVLSNVVCALIVLTSMTTIFQLAYQYDSAWIMALTYLLELVFIFQIYVKFHVTQVDEYGELEKDFDKVYKLYLKNLGGFALDLVPTIPFEIIAAFIPGSSSFTVFTYLRLTRLIRLIRVEHFFSQWEKQLDIDMLKVRLLKMLVFVLLIIHSLGCIWYVIACPSGVCREGSWADYQGYLSSDLVSTGQRFTDSIYWSVATLTSTGYGDIVAHTYLEMLFASFTMILGQLIVGSVLGNISSTLANRATQRTQYEKDLHQLKDNMDDNQVDKKLKESVIDYFDYLWIRNKGVDQLGQFKNLPYCMRTELALSIYGDHLRKLRLFTECSEAFFRDISQFLHEVILRAGDDMVDEGDIGDEMYIIHVGQVKVMSRQDPESVECILQPGDYFDDANLLYDIPRPRTIQAATQVDAVTLSMNNLNDAMERFPDDAKKIRETGCKLFSDKTTTKSYVCAALESPAAVSSTHC